MSEPLWSIQRALFGALSADPGLSELITGVFDRAPNGQQFPYVTVGDAMAQPDNAHGMFGANATVTVHIWSAAHGFAESLAIMGELRRLVDHESFVLDGHRTVLCHLEDYRTLNDPDHDIRHIPVRFRYITSAEE